MRRRSPMHRRLPPGLSAESFDLDADPSAIGGLLETWVFGEITRSLAHRATHFRLHHWRDRHGREVDMLATHAEGLIAIEIEAASEVSVRDFRHLKWFAAQGPGKGRRVTLIVLYLGDERPSFGNRAFALPASALCGVAPSEYG